MNIILLHGAWHGSWCWKKVRKKLQILGYDVFTPTLTGIGERSHLLSPAINLDTHIEDIVNLIKWEELTDVVLCGHSYSGAVITGVADHIPDCIHSLIYLDAFILEDRQSLQDTMPLSYRDLQIKSAQQYGDGWKLPHIPAEVFNVNNKDIEWVNKQCTMHPIATFQQPIRLSGKVWSIKEITYIYATDYQNSPFSVFYEIAKTKGWKTVKISCGHDIMLDKPDELTKIIINIVESNG